MPGNGASSSSSATAQGRQLACCIPVRGGEADGAPLEVLLVSSRRCTRRTEAVAGQGGEVCPQPNLVFPKGGWEPDETLWEAAVREAYEEAGVSGRLETPHVDTFSYESLKDRHDKGGHSRQRTVYVFVLYVTKEHIEWPEKDSRKRIWVKLASVSERLKHDWMRSVFDTLCAERGWNVI